MKSMNEVVKMAEDRGIPAKLTRAVIKQSGGIESFNEDAPMIVNHGADCGYHGWIYYNETVPFAESNRALILDFAEHMSDEFGEGLFEMIAGFSCLGDGYTASSVARAIYEKNHEDRTSVMNALAWFAVEEVARAAFDE